MIVGVAIRNAEVIISLPKPNRHCDCFRYAFEVLGIECPKLKIGAKREHQGFITDKGVYLDRLQAMRHAKRCGQKLIKTDDEIKHKWSHPLFSEDLW